MLGSHVALRRIFACSPHSLATSDANSGLVLLAATTGIGPTSLLAPPRRNPLPTLAYTMCSESMFHVSVRSGTVPLAAMEAEALYGTVLPTGPSALKSPYSVEVSARL